MITYHMLCTALSQKCCLLWSPSTDTPSLRSLDWHLWNGVAVNVQLDTYLQWFHACHHNRLVKAASRNGYVLLQPSGAECSDFHAIWLGWDLTALCLRPPQALTWGILLLLGEYNSYIVCMAVKPFGKRKLKQSWQMAPFLIMFLLIDF